MRQFTFRIFDQTATEQRLRLLDDQGKLFGERSLPQADIERFIAEVEKEYRSSKLDLSALGRRLYEWLDGPTERWLATLRAQHHDLTLHVDVESRLRHLPWELLYSDAYLCGHPYHCFTAVRRVNGYCASVGLANRPLRVLFMAASPEDVSPVLKFEAEEARILEATRHPPIELVVEESGSLEGLREQVTAVEAGYFDVFHLTGHADTRTGKPVFILENPLGFKYEADANELAAAFDRHWPRLLFLSGCCTSQALGQGELPSLCEALVQAGAPAVLGWALPVGDRDASQAAAYLYKQLASGERIDAAVAHARQQLLAKDNSRYWHLLRLYANATPLSALVTSLKTKCRAPLLLREARAEFLDAAGKVEVCPRDRFVGRRRPLQRCLRVLKSFAGEECYAEGVLLHGMGGLGKSSLAARLCDRLPDYRRLVWVGQAEGEVDELALLRVLGDKLGDAEAIARLNEPSLPLKARLQHLLERTLATTPRLFIFDDFEYSLDRSEEGNVSLKPGALPVLRDLLAAIREAASACRVIVTSRWQFPLPGPATLYAEGLESLRGADLEKKTQQLEALGVETKTNATIKERALKLAAGNPRLLELLDKVIRDQATDETVLLAVLEQTEAQFRETVLLEQLVEQQTEIGRRLLALVALYQLPVPKSAVAAVMGSSLPETDLQRAVNLGLVEAGRDPATQETRYYVSPLLDAALREELDDAERTEACRRAARHLGQVWWKAGVGIDEARELEIHRLALQAGELEIADELVAAISDRWMQTSRYREIKQISQDTLSLCQDYRLLHRLAQAEVMLGETIDAAEHYKAALVSCLEINAETKRTIVSERATICYHYAGLKAQQGDVGEAQTFYLEASKLQEQINDFAGLAKTLYKMSYWREKQGDLEGAQLFCQKAVELEKKSDNAEDRAAMLRERANFWQTHQQEGNVAEVWSLYQQSLEYWEKIGDVQSQAATLHAMANCRAEQKNGIDALNFYDQALKLREKIGDVRGEAETLHAIAYWGDKLGIRDMVETWNAYERSLMLKNQIGDVRGMAATCREMASLQIRQGNLSEALALYHESLALWEQIGDVQGKAATLVDMAWLAQSQDDREQARMLYLQSADAFATIRAWLDLATVLGNLGALGEEGAAACLGQAFWLGLHVQVPLKTLLSVTAALLQEIGFGAESAPLFVSAAMIRVLAQGQDYPEAERLQGSALGLLGQCAQGRGISAEQFEEWLIGQRLNDSDHVFPVVEQALAELVGDGNWLFERTALDKAEKYSTGSN